MNERITITEALIIIAIVGILLTVVLGAGRNHGKFEDACTEAGGKTVWDGRQWQCIKKLTT